MLRPCHTRQFVLATCNAIFAEKKILQVAVRMSHAATCRVALRKVEAASTFSATCNAMFRAWNLQCNAIALQVAKDIASCDMALNHLHIT